MKIGCTIGVKQNIKLTLSDKKKTKKVNVWEEHLKLKTKTVTRHIQIFVQSFITVFRDSIITIMVTQWLCYTIFFLLGKDQ